MSFLRMLIPLIIWMHSLLISAYITPVKGPLRRDNSHGIARYVSKGFLITGRPESDPLSEDTRDKLPYTLYLLKNKDCLDRKEMGTYYLDPSTSCGDIVQINAEDEYKVRRVTFIYRYGSRGLEVVRKKVDVTPVKNPRYKNMLQ